MLLRRFLQDEEGLGVVEIALILVVIIAIVAIFRTQITNLVNKIFAQIFEKV